MAADHNTFANRHQYRVFALRPESVSSELFGVDVRTVSYHPKEVYASRELSPEATLRRIWRAQREGNREVRREIEIYNLDAIISVGYRVSSAMTSDTPRLARSKRHRGEPQSGIVF